MYLVKYMTSKITNTAKMAEISLIFKILPEKNFRIATKVLCIGSLVVHYLQKIRQIGEEILSSEQKKIDSKVELETVARTFQCGLRLRSDSLKTNANVKVPHFFFWKVPSKNSLAVSKVSVVTLKGGKSL